MSFMLMLLKQACPFHSATDLIGFAVSFVSSLVQELSNALISEDTEETNPINFECWLAIFQAVND